MNNKDKEFMIISKYCKTYHKLNDDEKDAIYNFLRNDDYAYNKAYNRFYAISINSDRDIDICKDWITKYDSVADTGRAYNVSTTNCERIIRTFIKNIVTIAYMKVFKNSDSLLCYKLNNYDINYLARKGIITVEELVNYTIGDNIDNLRFAYTGTKLPVGLKKRIKFNKELVEALKR